MLTKREKSCFWIVIVALTILLSLGLFNSYLALYGILIDEMTKILELLPHVLMMVVVFSEVAYLIYDIFIHPGSKVKDAISGLVFLTLTLILAVLFFIKFDYNFPTQTRLPAKTILFLVELVLSLAYILIFELVYSGKKDNEKFCAFRKKFSLLPKFNFLIYTLLAVYDLFATGLFGAFLYGLFVFEAYTYSISYIIVLLSFFSPLFSLYYFIALERVNKRKKLAYFLISGFDFFLAISFFLTFIFDESCIKTAQHLFYIDFAASSYIFPFVITVFLLGSAVYGTIKGGKSVKLNIHP